MRFNNVIVVIGVIIALALGTYGLVTGSVLSFGGKGASADLGGMISHGQHPFGYWFYITVYFGFAATYIWSGINKIREAKSARHARIKEMEAKVRQQMKDKNK